MVCVPFVTASIQPERLTWQFLPILADLQPERTPLCWWTDCTFTSPATTVSRSFSEWFSGEVVIIFRCKDSVQTGTTLEVLTNGAAAQSSFIEPSGFAYGQK
ncbi:MULTISPECIES: hypothetical protein [Bacteroidaceae]|uniref:hypothetical protein n=1 Tax=Bacteroidaceae TaxID=815 RepID=UPI001B8A9EAA|nr:MULTISPECIES: hypothetical protein [Bacteroides]MBS5057642.1 hypothetical protein [Bacteroides sp.]MCZ2619660.1 hypothetical protein [Bacteroides fragilis]